MDNIKPQDVSKPSEQMIKLDNLMSLPAPYDQPGMEPDIKTAGDAWSKNYCASLDGIIGNDMLFRPKTGPEEKQIISKFLNGLDKLFYEESNGGYLQPLLLSFEYCEKCNTCSEACHVFKGSGEKEIYRPVFRSEVFRMLYKKYKKGGSLWRRFLGGDIEINVEAVMRLGELAYRCNLCRRCAQVCPLGLDNGLLAREIRKLFSQEMNMAPKLLHEKGSVLQLKTGSSTGIARAAFLDMMEFMEEDIADRTGKHYKIPIDKKGADILLIHNAGEFFSWPDGPAAFAIIFGEAGLDWTLSSDIAGYDCVNYGLFYDDLQARKLALHQLKAARELGVRRIIIGECGHAHRASAVTSDRLVAGGDNIPRESCFPLLWDLVKNNILKLNPARNNFPVTLHDPCNITRMMGIIQPQRQIIKAVCPWFKEMTPNGVKNYCCGGGSGFAVMNSLNLQEWMCKVSCRMKFKQVLEAFQNTVENKSMIKYVCAPCSNCKGTFRNMLDYYQATSRFNIRYGGLAELIVNAMVEFNRPYLEFLNEDIT